MLDLVAFWLKCLPAPWLQSVIAKLIRLKLYEGHLTESMHRRSHTHHSPLFFWGRGGFPPSDEDTKAEVNSEGMQANVLQEQKQDLPLPQLPSQPKESSVLGDLFGFEDLMKSEEPELVDQCSRSSFTSQNGRGKALGN